MRDGYEEYIKHSNTLAVRTVEKASEIELEFLKRELRDARVALEQARHEEVVSLLKELIATNRAKLFGGEQ